jgi:protein tyrosine/serine phosphatase
MKNLTRLMFALLLGISLPGVKLAQAEIVRFHEVAPGIYRGSRPEDMRDLIRLKLQGIRTIYTLVTDREDIAREQHDAALLGIKVVSVPMSPILIPGDRKIDFLLNEIQQPANQPVYLHCRHGKDRTGLIFGIFRVEVQGWDPHAAYDEMREIGFNPWLAGLEYAFWRRMRHDGHFADDLPLEAAIR